MPRPHFCSSVQKAGGVFLEPYGSTILCMKSYYASICTEIYADIILCTYEKKTTGMVFELSVTL